MYPTKWSQLSRSPSTSIHYKLTFIFKIKTYKIVSKAFTYWNIWVRINNGNVGIIMFWWMEQGSTFEPWHDTFNSSWNHLPKYKYIFSSYLERENVKFVFRKGSILNLTKVYILLFIFVLDIVLCVSNFSIVPLYYQSF